jgi:hypothetical protein
MISIVMELEKTAAAVPARKIKVPMIVILFSPTISATRPLGIEKTAIDRMNEVATQLSTIALGSNS